MDFYSFSEAFVGASADALGNPIDVAKEGAHLHRVARGLVAIPVTSCTAMSFLEHFAGELVNRTQYSSSATRPPSRQLIANIVTASWS